MDCRIGTLRQKRETILNVEWQIDGFSLSRTPYQSPTFSFSDSSWYLRVDSFRKDDENWIELDLARNENFPEETITFQTGLRKADGTFRLQGNVTWKFAGNCGYIEGKFLERSELLQREDEWLSSGALTVVCSLKKPYPPQELSRMSAGLKDILASKKFSDVTIHVGQQAFEAHKVILAASSPELAALFEREMSEEEDSGAVNIADCDPESFADFLQFLYTGAADITERNVLHLYRTARKYRIEELTSHCVAFITDILSPDNVFGVALLGDQYADENLVNICGLFLMHNIGSISDSKWKSFVEGHNLVGTKLVRWAVFQTHRDLLLGII